MSPPTVIEVFADVGCPFTHVGLKRFVAKRDELGRDDVVLFVRAWPLEIVNGRPLDPDFIAEEIDDLRAQLVPDTFVGFRVDAFPSTCLPAFALSAAAASLDPQVGEAVALELRDRLFERGEDIADAAVLAEVAEGHGVTFDADDRTAVRADHAEGKERGVIGSPHFFTPAGGFFCPALDISRDAGGHLRITADADGFEAFLRTCFA